jgi:ATP-dependent RNA helicase RhlE
VQVLVATDIVARGIDVEELSHVVNFDVPHVRGLHPTASAAPPRCRGDG